MVYPNKNYASIYLSFYEEQLKFDANAITMLGNINKPTELNSTPIRCPFFLMRS